MLFLDGPKGRLAKQWGDDLHPATRSLLLEFERWSTDQGIRAPLITQITRERDEQTGIYLGYWTRVVDALARGEKLSPVDMKVALRKRGKTAEELAREAACQFTWHECRTACDVRTRHYSETEMALVNGFFLERVCVPSEPGVDPECKPQWEWRVHDVAGPHLHIAFKAYDYRAKFDTRRPRNIRGPNG